MEDLDIKNEIEFRMNPSDFSVSPSDLIEIMNTFNIDENKVVEIYSEIISERKEELKNTTEEVLEYLRNSGNYNPSFREFKEMFDDFESQPINDKILIDMYKKATTDESQLSLFEIIQDEIKKVMSESYGDEDEDFNTAAGKISKNWGGSTRPKEKFDAAEFFGNAGDAAEADIRDEFGDDEFAAFGSMEDPRMLRDLDALNYEMDEAIDGRGLFQVEDAEGNIIKKGDLITPANGANKKGRIIGLGDDGAGNMQLSVSWEWPIEMKFTNPEEMGEEKLYPKDVVLASSKQMKENDSEHGGEKLRGVKVTYADGTVIPTSMAAHLTDDEIYKYFKKGKTFNIGNGELDNMQAVADVEIIKENDEELPGELSFDTKSLYHWFQDALYQLDGYDEASAAEIMEKAFNRDYDYKLKMNEMKDKKSELDESGDGEGLEIKNQEEEIDEARGLGKGVKNSGDRNVKLRDDHHSAPLTNINESLDGKIKNLIEGKVTKRQLQDFIREQAKEVAKKLK